MSGEMGKALAKKVTKEMPRKELEEHIASKLKEVRMCTLVTSKDDIPRGTPIEYFSEGLTIYISPDPGTKTRNIEANPNVSISICNNLYPKWETDWPTVWGLQISGKGELIKAEDPGYIYAWEVIDYSEYFKALGREEVIIPKGRTVLIVAPNKIELLEFGLIDKGFASKQVWQA